MIIIYWKRWWWWKQHKSWVHRQRRKTATNTITTLCNINKKVFWRGVLAFQIVLNAFFYPHFVVSWLLFFYYFFLFLFFLLIAKLLGKVLWNMGHDENVRLLFVCCCSNIPFRGIGKNTTKKMNYLKLSLLATIQ